MPVTATSVKMTENFNYESVGLEGTLKNGGKYKTWVRNSVPWKQSCEEQGDTRKKALKVLTYVKSVYFPK